MYVSKRACRCVEYKAHVGKRHPLLQSVCVFVRVYVFSFFLFNSSEKASFIDKELRRMVTVVDWNSEEEEEGKGSLTKLFGKEKFYNITFTGIRRRCNLFTAVAESILYTLFSGICAF